MPGANPCETVFDRDAIAADVETSGRRLILRLHRRECLGELAVVVDAGAVELAKKWQDLPKRLKSD
jgi:hypothetical protein